MLAPGNVGMRMDLSAVYTLINRENPNRVKPQTFPFLLGLRPEFTLCDLQTCMFECKRSPNVTKVVGFVTKS